MKTFGFACKAIHPNKLKFLENIRMQFTQTNELLQSNCCALFNEPTPFCPQQFIPFIISRHS